jgi:hypothetical protein
MSGGGDPMVRKMGASQGGSIQVSGVAWGVKDCVSRSLPASHRLRDSFTLQRVHQSRGIADQQSSTASRRCPDDSHLEPAPESASRLGGGAVDEAQRPKVIEERRKHAHRPGTF